MSELAKAYEHEEIEARWYPIWEERGYFEAEDVSDKPPYCIVIPPPNVTGSLHMGHGLTMTIQDILIRWRRMQGYNTLWMPGTDHAGIATQMVVERELQKEGVSRFDLGREAFLDKVWEWKDKYHARITKQLKVLGVSLDWPRERFTMDEGLSRAVRKVFVDLYEEGLIYRSKRLVNWSPGIHTVLSDLEVDHVEQKGHLWEMAYPVTGSDERLVVATTRPETMLGDTAVAVHPEDERYKHLIGKTVDLPLTGRQIPIVADDILVDMAFGTGAVKVTPAHDFNDFEVGRRHDLEMINIFTEDAALNDNVPEAYRGLDRYAARKKVVADLEAQGLLVGVKDHTLSVGHCQRTGVPVEPMLSDQWYVKIEPLAKPAIEAVEKGDTVFVPKEWEKTYFHWMYNIRDWCVSRQLWWGHQIPAWYCGSCEHVHVAMEAPLRCDKCGDETLSQDADVLDTWFSSGLWPFSTLGWPEETEDLETFYPTDVLVTGFDILFFWVARMVMTGIHFTGKLPFKTVHLTGLVRDAQGQKMSKTKGNTVDPLELVEEYGADALRFTLAVLDSPGRDIPLDTERMAGYRAFGNKIWNAVRFSLGRTEGAQVALDLDPAELAEPERWILSRLSRAEAEVNERFETMRFDEACKTLYGFFWGELCDWYIELAKPALMEARDDRPRVAEVLLTAIERSLRLLHPVMPFLTEELWQRLPGRERVHAESIALAPYPRGEASWRDERVEADMATFIELIGWVRNRRAELGLKPRETADVWLVAADEAQGRFLARQEPLARSVANLATWRLADELPEGASRDRVAGVDLAFVIEGRDLQAEERQRGEAELAEIAPQIDRLEGLLNNGDFTAKAPAEVVERNRRRLEELEGRRASILAAIASADG